MAFIGFNARTVAPAQGLELLQPGQYHALCVDSERKTNSAGTGEFLKLVFEIIDGEYKGRKVFDQITLSNANPKAVEVGHAILSQLCHAINVLDLQDSAQLHNIPVYIDVGIKKGNGEFQDKNRIFAYSNQKKAQAGGIAPFNPNSFTPPAPKPSTPMSSMGGIVASNERLKQPSTYSSMAIPPNIASIHDDVPF